MSWLLDTCALSEYVEKSPASQVISWLDEQDEAGLFISVISLGGIGKGILKSRQTDLHRGQKLTAWLGKIEQRFSGRILTLDATALHAWVQIAANAEQTGQPLLDGGLLIAIAQCHGLTIVTHNVQDFTVYRKYSTPG